MSECESRDVYLLMLSMFVRRLSIGFLSVVRPIYLALIGLDPLSVGFITTTGSIVGAIQSALFGVLSDKYGRKIFLAIGGLTSALRFLLYIISRDFWILMIAQGMGALGQGVGAGQPVVSGYLADRIKDDMKRTRVFSLMAVTNAIASSIGSLLAILPVYFQHAFHLLELDSYTYLFWLGFAFSLASLLLILFISDVKRALRKESDKLIILEASSLKKIMAYSIVRCTDGLAINFVSSLAPLYFHLRFGIGPENLAPIYAIARILPIPTYFLAPFFIDKFGHVKCLVAIRAISSIFALSLPFTWSFNLAGLLFIFYNLSLQFSMPIRQSFATVIADDFSTGSLVGISSSLRSFVRSFAPLVTGFFFQISQLYMPFIVSSSLFMLNALQFHVLYTKGDTTEAETSCSD